MTSPLLWSVGQVVEEVKAGAGLQDDQLDVFIHAQVDGHRLL